MSKALKNKVKLNDVVDVVADYGADPTGVADSTTAINAALAAASTAGGKGATVYFPQGTYITNASITVPTRVRLVGAGSRATIINCSYAGPTFIFDGTTNCGITGMRIGLGSSASAMALKLITTSADVRWMLFQDIEIAGASLINGQTGISAVTSGGHIITENVFNAVSLYQVSSPFNWNGPEGNFITGLTISGFGAGGATSAIGPTGHANVWQGRVAGAPFAGSIAYSEIGARNIVDLIVDIGASSTALNVTGSSNIIRLGRPQALTPIGTFSTTTTLIDGEFFVGKHIVSQGTTPTSGAFALGAGFGNTATISSISGNDQRLSFTINSSGTGQAAFPTIGYTYQNGSFPVAPILQVTRNGGNQLTVGGLGTSSSVSSWGFTFAGTPVAGESYAFTVTVG